MTEPEINSLLNQYRSTQKTRTRDRIVEQYTSLVESVARRFSSPTEPMEDLAQEGYMGLLKAIEGYDDSKGVKFSTYATHFVIGQIKHHLRDKSKIIKEPAWLQELNQRITRVIEALTQEIGRMPTAAEISAQVGMKEEQVAQLLTTREVFKVSSLDGSENEDDPGAYEMDRVKVDRAAEAEFPVEERLILQDALAKLKDLEQAVVFEFYYRERNQTEIAKSMGISCNYVSHILRNSTKKLRKIIASDELREAQMELALMRRRLEEQQQLMEEVAIVDSLTRLYNRKYFETRLNEELARGSRHGHPVSVLFVRLRGADGLQRAYGSIKAEDTIREGAVLVENNIRRIDLVCRYDSETYAVILPHTGEQVSVVEGRLLTLFSDWLKESGLAHGRLPLSVEIGSSFFPGAAAAGTELIQQAWEASMPEVRPLQLAA